MSKVFLRAEWRKLILANYAVDPKLLQPLVPPKTELDEWDNNHFVSLVGFQFLNVRLLGFRIPFHVNFPEVNLRFYVRTKVEGEWRRGVVFVKEIVPKPAISFVANTLFGEKYATHPVKEKIEWSDQRLEVGYAWKAKGQWNELNVASSTECSIIQPGSEDEFITQHFWGYSHKGQNRTIEYNVEHPLWESYTVNNYQVTCNFTGLYGDRFKDLHHREPDSVMLAEGSPILIYNKKII